MINTDEYIDEILAKPEFENQPRYLLISLWINWKTLFYSRKWLLYIIIGILPLVFTIFTDDKLFGYPSAREAFIASIVVEDGFTFYMILFAFGCLLITQPLSTDEISDHMIELYLVRPLRRETIWASRWIIANLGIWLANMMILTIYYIFYHIFDDKSDFKNMVSLSEIEFLIYGYVLVLLATLCYSGIFLYVGFMKRGFSFGVVLAVLESFFLSLLFLRNSKYIPKTHIHKIAETYFEDYYSYIGQPDGMTLFQSYGYVFILMLLSFFLGLWYLRRRQFN